jgi:hypothetical protein
VFTRCGDDAYYLNDQDINELVQAWSVKDTKIRSLFKKVFTSGDYLTQLDDARGVRAGYEGRKDYRIGLKKAAAVKAGYANHLDHGNAKKDAAGVSAGCEGRKDHRSVLKQAAAVKAGYANHLDHGNALKDAAGVRAGCEGRKDHAIVLEQAAAARAGCENSSDHRTQLRLATLERKQEARAALFEKLTSADEESLSEADLELRTLLLNSSSKSEATTQALTQLIRGREMVDDGKVMDIADEVMLRLEPQIEQWHKDQWHLYVMKGNVAAAHCLLCEVRDNSKKTYKPANQGDIGFSLEMQSRYNLFMLHTCRLT